MTMRTFLKNFKGNVVYFAKYCRAIFTNRAVILSLVFTIGGLVGWSLAVLLRIGAFFAWGSITLPYTQSPLAVAAAAFIGGFTALVVSQSIAAIRFFNATTLVRKFPYALPAGTTWEQIILQFHNDENVIIRVGQFKHTANYIEFGLYDGRGKQFRPNEQWNFLKVLAKLNGEIRITDSEATDTYKKQKQILSQKLKEYFGIDYDPFHPYRTERAYRIKMTLIPPPEMLGADAGRDSSTFLSFDDDIRESYLEQTPFVDDSR